MGQLYLNGRFGAVDKVRALEHFELTKILVDQHQRENGGQGFCIRADSLRWIEQKTPEGILRCQPNVRSLMSITRLNPPASAGQL